MLSVASDKSSPMLEMPFEALVSLSSAIATVRTRDELNQVVAGHLKRRLHFNDMVVFLLGRDKITQRLYPQHFEKGRTLSAGHVQLLSLGDYSVSDGIIDAVLTAGGPVVWTLAALLKGRSVPWYIHFWSEQQVNRFAGIPLLNKNEVIGAAFFYSTEESAFPEAEVTIIRAISPQLSAAVSNIIANEEMLEREREKSILLSISNDIAMIRDKNELLRVLNDRARGLFLFPYTHTIIGVSDLGRQTYTGYILDPASKSRMHPNYNQVVFKRYTLQDNFSRLVLSSREPVIFDLDEWIGRPDTPDWMTMNYECDIREVVVTQLTAGHKHIGLFLILSVEKGRFQSSQIKLIQGIAYQVSTAVANILANEEILQRENEKTTLLALSGEVAGIRNRTDLHRVVNEKVKKILPISHILTCVIDREGKTYSPAILDPDSPCKNHKEYAEIIAGNCLLDEGITRLALAAEQPVTYDLAELVRQPHVPRFLKLNYECGCKEVVFCPLGNGGPRTGFLVLFMNEPGFQHTNYASMVSGVAAQLSTAIANIVANDRIEAQLEEISRYKQRLENVNLYLQEEIQTTHNYSEIIGTSEAMQRVFKLVSQVADTQTTVLLQGETGTGKELIARALHNSSSRKDKVMVKVNCAALPANLIESELFGHEKGSFTGALERRIGKFELAHNSTLFLDEVGELPLDLQVKLLRVLQEREIERIGGNSTIRVDVRIIAATNRDLHKEVQLGNFRSDLYFRLNVFPIAIPSLRDRKEDIPPIATHFLAKYTRKDSKGSLRFSESIIHLLMDYSWPGNVRELEHLVERSILLANGPVITEVHLPFLGQADAAGPDPWKNPRIKTIDEVEREHIIAVLKKCNGKVSGPGGAAEALEIPSTTLNSKMKRLKIKKIKYGI